LRLLIWRRDSPGLGKRLGFVTMIYSMAIS
jgi:hypothetical protein